MMLGERVALLDDYDFPARTSTEILSVFFQNHVLGVCCGREKPGRLVNVLQRRSTKNDLSWISSAGPDHYTCGECCCPACAPVPLRMGHWYWRQGTYVTRHVTIDSVGDLHKAQAKEKVLFPFPANFHPTTASTSNKRQHKIAARLSLCLIRHVAVGSRSHNHVNVIHAMLYARDFDRPTAAMQEIRQPNRTTRTVLILRNCIAHTVHGA